MQDFRQLLVWKRAHAFALNVRRVVETLPRPGYSDLKSQMTRAAQSIVDNIVEGCGAASRPEFARYLDISIKSTSEVDYQLEFARDLGVIPHDVWKPLATEVIEIRKMLSALRRSVVAAALRDKQDRARRTAPSRTERRSPNKRSGDANSVDGTSGDARSGDVKSGDAMSEDPGTDD